MRKFPLQYEHDVKNAFIHSNEWEDPPSKVYTNRSELLFWQAEKCTFDWSNQGAQSGGQGQGELLQAECFNQFRTSDKKVGHTKRGQNQQRHTTKVVWVIRDLSAFLFEFKSKLRSAWLPFLCLHNTVFICCVEFFDLPLDLLHISWSTANICSWYNLEVRCIINHRFSDSLAELETK